MYFSKSTTLLVLWRILPLLSLSDAFSISTPNINTKSTTTRLNSSRLDQGWDNDDYLNALSAGANSKEMEEVNVAYKRQSDARAVMNNNLLDRRYGDGAPAPGGEMKGPPVPAMNDEDMFGMPKIPEIPPQDEGGQRFRRMMDAAQKGAGGGVDQFATAQFNQQHPPPPAPVPTTQNPMNTDVSTSDGAGAGAPIDPEAYYQMQLQWQESMKVYAEFKAANPESAANMPPPPPPPPPSGFIGQQQQSSPESFE